jgi:hypothetical protein
VIAIASVLNVDSATKTGRAWIGRGSIFGCLVGAQVLNLAYDFVHDFRDDRITIK